MKDLQMVVGTCQLGDRVGKITSIKQNLLECGWSKSYMLAVVQVDHCNKFGSVCSYSNNVCCLVFDGV